MGLRRLIMHLTSGSSEAELEFVVGAVAASIKIGLDGVFRTSELFGQKWACRGRWVNGETFILEQEARGKVLRRCVTLSFQGDALSFKVHDLVTDSVDIYYAKVAGIPSVGK